MPAAGAGAGNREGGGNILVCNNLLPHSEFAEKPLETESDGGSYSFPAAISAPRAPF